MRDPGVTNEFWNLLITGYSYMGFLERHSVLPNSKFLARRSQRGWCVPAYCKGPGESFFGSEFMQVYVCGVSPNQGYP